MNSQEKEAIAGKVLQEIRNLQRDGDEWVDLAQLGKAGIQYKELGFPKLRPFLEEFRDVLEFDEKRPINGKPPVIYVRPISGEAEMNEDIQPKSETDGTAHPVRQNTIYRGEKKPTDRSWLFSWASILDSNIKELSELALEEKWYYGNPPTQGKEKFPILKNYLAYTFKRLVFEDKIQYAEDTEKGGEYAAFNTGLVDRKYEYIYALFRQNTRYPKPYWYLLSFVVAGEDKGKTLVSLFNPLPERANYFENKIENMLYDTSTGDLSCDYTHILTERTYRLPLDFLKDNCPEDFLKVNGVGIDDMYYKPLDEKKKVYFSELGDKIKNNARILNRLKNRIDDAVSLALKRVEWNYKTAIPMYFPTKNKGSLLLPLALVDEENVDLALVVERQISGSYQGQTVLPLNMAYNNSRLVARPDSDWLKTDLIPTAGADDLDDND